jgi:hypothetical protein
MIREAVVLGGVEHLEERGGGIAAEILADLVDLVQDEYRVTLADLPQPAQDPAW